MNTPPDHRSKRTIIRQMIVAAKLIAAIGSVIAAIAALMDKLIKSGRWAEAVEAGAHLAQLYSHHQ